MENLYEELKSREKYLKSIEQTEQVKTRLSELMLVMVTVQQSLITDTLSIKSRTFIVWYETHGFMTTSNSNVLEKDGIVYDIKNVFKHYCNLLEFNN